MCYIRGDHTWGTIEIDGETYKILHSTRAKIPNKAWDYRKKYNFALKFGSQNLVVNYEVVIENNKLYLMNIEFSKWEKVSSMKRTLKSVWSANLIKDIFGVEKLFLKEQNSDIKLLLDKKVINREKTCERRGKIMVQFIEMQLLVLSFKDGELIATSSKKEEFTNSRILNNYIPS